MKKAVLLYGLCGGVLIAALRFVEYRFLVVEHSIEIYGGLIALLFASVGIWLGPDPHEENGSGRRPRGAGPGRRPVRPGTTRRSPELGITPRELEILEHIAGGMSTREIAAALFVSENTVKTHASRLFDKLNVNRRTQAVQVAKTLGLIS